MSFKYEPTHLFAEAGPSEFIPCVRDRKNKGDEEDDSEGESNTIAYLPQLRFSSTFNAYKYSWYEGYKE